MRIFLISTAGIVLLIAGYLLWISRFQGSGGSRRSRFRVRLTSLFLICVLLPAIPMLFFTTALLTQSLAVFVVPEVERSLLAGLEAIKLQIENHAQLFDSACNQRAPSPELLAAWRIAHWSKWADGREAPRLLAALPALAEKPSSYPPEPWGKRQSRVRLAGETAFSQVWLPSVDSTMVLIEFPVDPGVMAAKEDLGRAASIYNSLALIKEEVVRGQLIWALASAAIFVLAATAALAARFLSRQISEPIEQLSSAMSRAATGDLAFQANIVARDEIAQLVVAFNKMLRDLRDSHERLLASERLAAWREVARQVSHEIKNPLTPIQLALHRLHTRFEKLEPEHQVVRESLQSIEEELAALRRLADEFSAFARLPEPRREHTDLNEVVGLVVRLHQGVGERLIIHTDLHPGLPAKMLDRDQMRRVLTNLLKNAAEAAPEADTCEVHLRTALHGARVMLEVSDTGPGLSPESLAQIFQPNFTTKREGAGLGLAMVKRIIEQHGGSIEVSSAMGKGTTFRIML